MSLTTRRRSTHERIATPIERWGLILSSTSVAGLLALLGVFVFLVVTR